MRLYYICDRSIWQASLDLFTESHAISTDNPDKILVACRFPSEGSLELWEKLPGVSTLPHPLLDSSPMHPDHIALLQGIGAAAGDKIADIAKKAGAVHPLLKLSRI